MLVGYHADRNRDIMRRSKDVKPFTEVLEIVSNYIWAFYPLQLPYSDYSYEGIDH